MNIHKLKEELFEQGYKIYNLDLNKSINKNITTIKCDVTQEKDVIKALNEIPKIDVLVNSAGIFGCYYVEDTPEDFLDIIIDVNLKGYFLVTKHALPKLRDSKGNKAS